MTNIKLDTLSRSQLLTLQSDVAKALKSFDERSRKEALASAKAAAREHGFSLRGLLGATGGAKKTSKAAKYKHPVNPDLTWSGSGRQPKWFKELIASGVTPESLLV